MVCILNMIPEHEHLVQTVQHNCHISDAQHAGDYTMCIYLLKMREYYRWEKSHAFGASMSRKAIGEWLTERETLWEELADHQFSPVELNGCKHDPFNDTQINNQLLKHNLVYSAGVGVKGRHHFFIGDLESSENHDEFTIYVSGKEYARDLTSPPAMTRGNNIYIRRESFRRLVWEKIEEWRWNKPDNAMARALAYYDLDHENNNALDEMTNDELDSVVLHELGEIAAGDLLPGWSQMMSSLHFTRAEMMARAVRDHLADALSTLPELINKDNHASIHFYFANMTHMRKHIAPSLMNAYNTWRTSNNTRQLEKQIDKSKDHWLNLASKSLELFAQHRRHATQPIEDMIENNHF